MSGADEALKQFAVVKQKAETAQAINGSIANFKAMKQARVDRERDSEMFSLKKKQAELELKKMENDPMMDPSVVSMQRKNLKLTLQAEENKLKIAGKTLDYQMADTSKQIQILREKANKINKMSEDYPEMFGDLQIIPNMETGQVELKPRKTTGEMTIPQITKSLSELRGSKSIKDSRSGIKTEEEVHLENLLKKKLAAKGSSQVSSADQYEVGEEKEAADGTTYVYLGNDEWEPKEAE